MKKSILRIIIATILLATGFSSIWSQSTPLEQVMNSFNCTENEAREFLTFVSEQVDIIQYSFTKIASHTTSAKEKQLLVNHLLNNIFYSSATIQVSSVSSNKIYTQSVKSYLNNLKNLSSKYNYRKIELYFDPDYLHLGKIEKLHGNKFTFNIGQKQYFRGCWSESGCYLDMTYKDFAYIFDNGILKIKRVTVMETISTSNESVDDVGRRHIYRFQNN